MISHPLPIDSPVNLKDMLWNDFKIEVPIFDENETLLEYQRMQNRSKRYGSFD